MVLPAERAEMSQVFTRGWFVGLWLDMSDVNSGLLGPQNMPGTPDRDSIARPSSVRSEAAKAPV